MGRGGGVARPPLTASAPVRGARSKRCARAAQPPGAMLLRRVGRKTPIRASRTTFANWRPCVSAGPQPLLSQRRVGGGYELPDAYVAMAAPMQPLGEQYNEVHLQARPGPPFPSAPPELTANSAAARGVVPCGALGVCVVASALPPTRPRVHLRHERRGPHGRPRHVRPPGATPQRRLCPVATRQAPPPHCGGGGRAALCFVWPMNCSSRAPFFDAVPRRALRLSARLRPRATRRRSWARFSRRASACPAAAASR